MNGSRVQRESCPLALLYEKLGALQGAKTVRVFLDACFSGRGADLYIAIQ